MIKSWHLHKSDHKFDITINDVDANGIDAEIQIDNDKTVEIDEIKGNIIKFKWYVRIADTSYLGVRFNDFEGQEEKFAELTNYYNSLKDKQTSGLPSRRGRTLFRRRRIWDKRRSRS